MLSGVFVRIFPKPKEVVFIYRDIKIEIKPNAFEDIEVVYETRDFNFLEKVETMASSRGFQYYRYDDKLEIKYDPYYLSAKGFEDFLKKTTRSEKYLDHVLKELFPS